MCLCWMCMAMHANLLINLEVNFYTEQQDGIHCHAHRHHHTPGVCRQHGCSGMLHRRLPAQWPTLIQTAQGCLPTNMQQHAAITCLWCCTFGHTQGLLQCTAGIWSLGLCRGWELDLSASAWSVGSVLRLGRAAWHPQPPSTFSVCSLFRSVAGTSCYPACLRALMMLWSALSVSASRGQDSV